MAGQGWSLQSAPADVRAFARGEREERKRRLRLDAALRRAERELHDLQAEAAYLERAQEVRRTQEDVNGPWTYFMDLYSR